MVWKHVKLSPSLIQHSEDHHRELHFPQKNTHIHPVLFLFYVITISIQLLLKSSHPSDSIGLHRNPPGILEGQASGSQLSKALWQAASTLAAAAVKEKAAVGMELVATTCWDATDHPEVQSFGFWRWVDFDLSGVWGGLDHFFFVGFDAMFDGVDLEFHGFWMLLKVDFI